MKRKLFMTIIAVLILCLTCGMLMVACNKKTAKPDIKPSVPETRPEKTEEMMTTVWKQIKSSTNVGESKNFVVDFDIALNVDDETPKNNDVLYSLVGKASIDVNEGKESDIFIELKATKNGESKVLFGFAYDVEKVENVDVPFVYISAGGSEYKKINGFYLTQLVADVQSAIKNSQGASKTILDKINSTFTTVSGFLSPDTLFPLLSQAGIVSKTGVVSDYGKTFTINVNVAPVFPLLGGLMKDNVLSKIGLTVAQLDSVAKGVAGYLGFQGVETFAQLCTETGKALQFLNTQLVFRFDDKQTFSSATINIDYNKNNDGVPSDFAKYTLSVNKAVIKIGELDVFAGSPITDEVRAQKSVNLLNFSVKGSAVSYKGEEIAHRYTIEVQSDINPFELFSLIGNTSKENIVATLKKLGYFHLEINEVNENGDKLLNIITLHSKFDEGFAVANLNLNDASVFIVSLPIGLGGVYDFDGLVDIIGTLSAKSGEATSAAGTDIFGIVAKLVGFFHVNNIKTNGVTVDIKSLVVALVEQFGIKLDSTLSDVLSQVLDCDTVNIKLEMPTFGTCTQVETSSVESGIRTSGSFESGKDFIKKIVSLDGFATEILQDDSNMGRYVSGSLEAGKCFEMTGINLKGENAKTSGFIMATEGLDVTKAGEQEVTFYIAIGSDIMATINTASLVTTISVPDNIPINGVLVFKTKINVAAYDPEAQLSFENLAENKEVVIDKASGKDWFKKVLASAYRDLIMKVGEKSYKLSQNDAIVMKDGKDVSAEVIKNGMSQTGTYTVTVGIGKYRTEQITFRVEDAYLEKTSEAEVPTSIGIGKEFSLPTYKIIVCNFDGSKSEQIVEPVYKLNRTVTSLDKIFDIKDGVYTLKKDLNFVGKKFTISYTATGLLSGNKELKVEIPITGPEVTKGSSVYFGNSLNNFIGIKLDSINYSVIYEDGKWIAKSAEGKTLDLNATFEWTSANSGNKVTFDDNGYITNYNTADSNYRDKVYYTINVDGCSYSNSFTAYELYANDKTGWWGLVSLNSKLDGYISYVNYIYHEADGVKTALEFKYGANGYGIYVNGTDTKVYDVKVTVFNGEEDVTSTVLADGALAQAGTYKVQYEINAIYGTAFTISHNVKVNA